MRNDSFSILKRSLAIGCSVFAPSFLNAANVSWDSGGSDAKWETALNWDTDTLPTTADTAYLSDGGTARFDTSSGTVSVSRLYVGYTGDGALDLSGGTLNATKSGSSTVFLVGNGAVGTANISGGTLSVGHRVQIGAGANGQGTLKLSGGNFVVGRAGTSKIDTSFGTTSLDLGFAGTGTSGLLEISGGAFTTRSGAVLGPTGTFKVEGAGATQIGIGSQGTVDGFWIQKSGGILQVRVAGDGVTPIFIDDVADDGAGLQGNVVFEAGALLDVSHISTPIGGTFTVMEWEGTVSDGGLAFAPGVDTDVWSFAINEVDKTLTVTAANVPITSLFWQNTLGDNDFANGQNWDLNLDFAGMNLNVDKTEADKAIIGEAITANMSALRIGFASADGELEHSGGSFKATSDSSDYSRVGGNGYSGTWTMSGGGATINTIQLGISGGTGNLSIEGGAMDIARAAGDYSLFVGNGGDGNFEISSGRLRTRAGIKVGSTGSFAVEGTNPIAVAVGSLNNVDGRWYQETGGVLKIRLDESSEGVTKIFVDEKDGTPGNSWDGNVTFEAGALLDVGYLGAENLGTFTVMEWEGELVNGGLEFAPGTDRMVWSMNLDEVNKRLTVTARDPDAPRTTLVVDSIEDFVAATALDHHDVTLVPGEYWLEGPDAIPGQTKAALLELKGFNTVYNLDGVTINVSTEELAGYSNKTLVFVVLISGDHSSVEGLTLKMVHLSMKGVDAWGNERQWTANKSSVIACVTGSNTVIRNCEITTGGSYPYGYGDAFGKGSRPNSGGVTNAAFISHKKQSGFLITDGADNVLVEDVTLNMRSFGHAFFLQGGASNIVFRRCQALGDEMADSDDIIAHPVYQEWGSATYREPIPADIRISKHEGGFRWYSNSASAINGWPSQSSNVLIEDCRIERMRTGVAPGYGEGYLRVLNTEAIDCEFGFATSAGADEVLISGCKSNAVNGPAVYFQYGADNAVVDVELTGDTPATHVWPIALIGGSNNHVTITSSAAPGTYSKEAYVNLSQGWREWRHRPGGDIDVSGSNYSKAGSNNTVLNYTDQIMVFGKNASNNVACVSNGGVINKGTNNEYTGTTLVPAQILVQDTWSSPTNPMDVPWAQWDSNGNQILPTAPYEVFSGLQYVDEVLALGGSSADEGTIIGSGATLEMASGFALQGEKVLLSGNGTVGQGALFSEGSSDNKTRLSSSSGSITIDGDTSIGVATEGNQLLVGRIRGNGSLTKLGLGQLTMESNSNLFTGALVVAEGSIKARSNKATTDLVVAAGALFAQNANTAVNQSQDKTAMIDGVLDVNARGVSDGNSLSANLGSLSGSGIITSTSTAANQVLNIKSESIDSSFSGAIEGTLSLVKSGGNSSLELSGINSYTGPTQVTGGKLVVNGRIGGSSLVTVDTGAALGGRGEIVSTVVLGGGARLAAGNSIGELTLGSMSLTGGSVLKVEIDDALGVAGTTGWDLVTVSGAVSFAGGTDPILVQVSSLNGSVANFDGTTDLSWDILKAGSGVLSLVAAGFDVSISDVPSSENGIFSIKVSDTALTLVYEVDSDGDTVPDNVDAFPLDPDESVDTDGDGKGDNGDAFPNDPSESMDSDGDGVGDNADVFPTDASESADADSDGTGDNADLDDDNDGTPDKSDAFPNDASEVSDNDGDGVGDNADLDDDNDGVADVDDSCPTAANADQADINLDGYGDVCVDTGSTVSKKARIGYNPYVGAGAVIERGVLIRDHALIGENVHIKREATIMNNFTIGDSSSVDEYTWLGDDVFIGSEVEIGRFVIVKDNAELGDIVELERYSQYGENLSVGNASSLGFFTRSGDDLFVGDESELSRFGRYGDNVRFGDRVETSYFTRVGSNVTIGDDVEMGYFVTIGEGTTIGDGVEIGRFVRIGKNVTIADGVTLRSGTRVRDGSVID